MKTFSACWEKCIAYHLFLVQEAEVCKIVPIGGFNVKKKYLRQIQLSEE